MASRILLLLALPGTLFAQMKILVHLPPATNAAFDKYVGKDESQMGKPLTAAKPGGEVISQRSAAAPSASMAA